MLRTLTGIPFFSAGHQGLLEAYDTMKGAKPKGSYSTAYIPDYKIQQQRRGTS